MCVCVWVGGWVVGVGRWGQVGAGARVHTGRIQEGEHTTSSVLGRKKYAGSILSEWPPSNQMIRPAEPPQKTAPSSHRALLRSIWSNPRFSHLFNNNLRVYWVLKIPHNPPLSPLIVINMGSSCPPSRPPQVLPPVHRELCVAATYQNYVGVVD